MYRYLVTLILCLSFVSSGVSQGKISRIEPPFWWSNMAEPGLQLLVKGDNISELNVLISSDFVDLKEVHKVENPNYLFIDLEVRSGQIKETKKSTFFTITFQYQREVVATYEYELKVRRPGSAVRRGFDNSDVIYLLMPDRFANGDPENDNHPEMYEKVDRSNPDGRHGGDIEGIRGKLDYLADLGVTAVWVNPLLENNMEAYSYHGYAITDFYCVDPRYGSNKDYLKLVQECQEKEIKVIMDQVFNHCGSNHWWMDDLPEQDWIHQFPEYTSSNYRGETVMDPYASEKDKKKMLTGWFDRTMPDLNQHNDFLANYLIQNSIWWVEYANLDGIRMDTYPYSYGDFMEQWMERIRMEYPFFKVLGEAWLQKEAHTAYFQENIKERYGTNTHLQVVTDFPTHYALAHALNEDDTWTEGLARIYYTLSHDYLYTNPRNTVVFADNHDLSRYFSLVEKDLMKWKMGMAFLLTMRGTPMIYYGTEILMTGLEEEGHGYIREDFPGGWPGDPVDMFSAEGRSGEQEEAFNYLTELLNWRKDKEVIHSGNLVHFIPSDGLYVCCIYDDDDAVMVVLNNNDEKPKQVDPKDYVEVTGDFATSKNVLTGEGRMLSEVFTIPPKSAVILDLD